MTGSGRHRRGRSRLVPVAATLAVVATGGGVVALSTGLGAASGCEGEVRELKVTATPALEPVVAEMGDRLSEDSGGCLAVTVDAARSIDVVAGLSAGSIRPPDVWIPDSSLWLTRADVDALASVPRAESVATSPLVIALGAAGARRLDPTGRPTVADLIGSAKDGRPLTLAMSGERLSPERVGAVVALRQATGTAPGATAALTALLRETDVVEERPETLLSGGNPSVGVPVSEQAVWSANREGRDVVAVYPGGVTFDHPYAVLTDDDSLRGPADQLFGLLRGGAGQRAVEAAGFRAADGSANPQLDGRRGVDGSRPAVPIALGRRSLSLAERTLEAVNLDARLLAVLDVSGSMAWPVAGPDGVGPSRIDIATAAAGEGLALYPDSTEVGLWVFPGGPGTGAEEVAPVAEVGRPGLRAQLSSALRSIRAVPDGDTPLYAATLAAVRAHQQSWDPGKVNAVVVLSDGRNTRPGVGLTALLERLRAVRDSDRPVPVITVAFGPDSDAAALEAISAAAGGTSYLASDAADIRSIFLDALGRRVCRPDCGRRPDPTTQEATSP